MMSTLVAPSATARRTIPRAASERWLAVGLLVIALGLAAVALLGRLVGDVVAGMAVAMQVNDGPTATAVGTALMIVLGLVYAVLAIALCRPLFRRDRRTRAPELGP